MVHRVFSVSVSAKHEDQEVRINKQNQVEIRYQVSAKSRSKHRFFRKKFFVIDLVYFISAELLWRTTGDGGGRRYRWASKACLGSRWLYRASISGVGLALYIFILLCFQFNKKFTPLRLTALALPDLNCQRAEFKTYSEVK